MPAVTIRAVGAIVTCVVAAGIALAAPANAAARPITTAGLHDTIARPGAVHPNTAGTTNLGAGYFAHPGDAQGTSSASATFTVPSITCVRPHDNEWLLPGIWAYDAGGTLTQQVDVNVNCNAGALLLTDVICIGGTCDQTLPVTPGDKIIASLAYTASATVGTIKDATSGIKKQVIGSATTADSVIFVGDKGPSQFGVNTVPQFTIVRFSAVQINGEYLADFGADQDNLKTAGTIQILTSKISANGDGFTTTFHHS